MLGQRLAFTPSLGCSQISPNHRIFWVGRGSLGSSKSNSWKFWCSLYPFLKTRSGCFHHVVVAWTACPSQLPPGSVLNATASSRLERGERWWHSLREGRWDLAVSGKARCAELLMASGAVSPSVQSLQEVKAQFTTETGGLFFQVSAEPVCWTDQGSLDSGCTHWTHIVTREIFIRQSI